MEKAKNSRRQRSFVRRLLAPVAALALVSAGGWGGYYYYTSGNEAVTPADESVVAAHSAEASQDELKMLFGTTSSTGNTAKQQEPAKEPTVEILAAEKPASPDDRYSSTQLEPAQPAVAAPQSLLGDRYAAALTAPAIPPKESQAVEAQTAPDENDIARGQEPSANPLRTSDEAETSSDLDARAAFGAALAKAPQVASNPFSAQQPVASAGIEQVSNALDNARQLSAPPTNPPQQYGRYQAAPTTPPMFQAEQQTPTPAPPLALASPPAEIQQPLPAMPSEQTPPMVQAQPRESSPLGAPPAALQANRRATPPISALASESGTLTPTPGLTNLPGTGRPGERLLEGAQSPAITIQKLAPEEIQVGRRCTFAIRVQNTGQRTAQNVQIRDEVPMGTELVGTAPRADVSGSEIVWDLGTLSPGEERTVEMELLPREEGELGSVAMVSITAQASAKSRCTRPELALRLTSAPQVHAGNQHVVQIEVTNPGSGDATNVMLLETVPAGVSHEAGPALEFEVGTLRAGETRRLELLLTAEQAGKITNVMTARADAGLQIEQSCEFEVIAPELQLSIEGPQRRFLERPATYHVSIDNPGTASAKDIQLVTHLPKGMQFVSANNMGEYDSATHSVHWSLAELPANETGTVELVALPVEAGEQTLEVATKARQGLEDRTDKQVIVEGLSALTFEVVDVESLIEIDNETTYEIRVENKGSKAATNVQVAAILPDGMQPISGRGETRHAIQGERVLFAPLPQLAPKAEATFYIQARGVRPGDQRVRVQITDDDLAQPIVKEVNTRVYADQ